MYRRALQISATWAALTALLMLLKPVFTIAVGGYSLWETLLVMWHGIPMDMSAAGYLAILPALLIIGSIWIGGAWLRITARIIFGLLSLIVALIMVADVMLYPYWGFRIDTTPIFYFMTSPSAATASVLWWHWIVGPAAICVIAAIWYYVLNIIYSARWFAAGGNKRWGTGMAVLAMWMLFLPIRGGVTVSTMNLSRAYFSTDQRLNHAAIDPVFSLLYSAAHPDNSGDNLNYLAPVEADAAMQRIMAHSDTVFAHPDTLPDIRLVILESFSAHLMPSLGGEPVAVKLDSIASSGWLFSRAYASSFRTDRAMPAILNGYPALQSACILKYVSKIDRLPSLGAELKNVGYDMSFFYGGDIDFGNMKALHRAAGFDKIISDVDFPINQRLSKWGVDDEYVFRAALDAAESETSGEPHFSVVQTSSSHEPFEVPFHGPSVDKRVNAFQYTDSCLAVYINGLSRLPSYDNTLVIIVPDHYGSYPEHLDTPAQMHHVPIVFAGGYLRRFSKDEDILAAPASQTDIAATVLAMCGLPYDKFAFSRNLLDPARMPVAFFSRPGWIAAASDDAVAVYNTVTDTPETDAPDSLYVLVKAFYQTLNQDFNKR